MKPWDILTWKFPHGEHPAVVISPAARCDNPDLKFVNVLACQSKRALRPPKITESILDEADGLDWPIICRCDLIWLAPKDELIQQRGSVTAERQREISSRIICLFELLKS